MKKLIMLSWLLLLAGCASSGMYLPKHAITDPGEGISIPSVKQLEKSGIQYVTSFIAPMSDDLLVELVNGGGVYPALAMQPNGEIVRGYAYLAGPSYWCDFLLQYIFASKEKLSEEVKILSFNRDAGYAYTLTGIELSRIVWQDKKTLIYDPKKFDNDEKYRRQLFEKAGQTTQDVEKLWKLYLKSKGASDSDLNEVSCVQIVKVGTPEWQEFTDKVALQMPHQYKVGNDLRSGHLPIDDFRQEAIKNPGFTNGQRFMKTAALPLFVLPFSGVTIPVMAGASIVGSAVNASIDTDWSASTARSKTLRINMAPVIAYVLNQCRIQIYKRDFPPE